MPFFLVANFTDASLQGVRLSRSQIVGAVFVGASMQGAVLDDV